MSKLLKSLRAMRDLKHEPPEVVSFVDPEEVYKITLISPSDLTNSMLTLPPYYARYSIKYAKAKFQRDGLKNHADRVFATLCHQIRNSGIDKKMTKLDIESLAQKQGVVKRCAQALSEAQAELDACQRVLESLSMKRDMLVQLNKNQNREWDYQQALKKKESGL